MAIRYEPTNDDVAEVLEAVRTIHFPELKNAKIITLFDLKKRTSCGNITLARIMGSNDLLRQLTRDDKVAVDGVDYIVTLDKVTWEAIERIDKVRLMRHELRHAFLDVESASNPYKIIDHDLTDFHEEVELNREDPRWRERLAELTSGIYEQKADAAKDKKHSKKKRGQ
jgi:hypothetical protein